MHRKTYLSEFNDSSKECTGAELAVAAEGVGWGWGGGRGVCGSI